MVNKNFLRRTTILISISLLFFNSLGIVLVVGKAIGIFQLSLLQAIIPFGIGVSLMVIVMVIAWIYYLNIDKV